MLNYFSRIKMRFLLSALSFALLLITAGFKTSGYRLNGEITAPDGTLIKLSYSYQGKDFADSALVKNNQVYLAGVLPETVICTLSNSINPQIKIFVAENKPMIFSGSLSQFYDLKIKGSAQDELFSAFRQKTLSLSGDYRKQIKASGGDVHDKKNPVLTAYRKRVDSLTQAFVSGNKNSTVASLAIIDSYLTGTDHKEAGVSYNLLSAEGRKNSYAKRVYQFINVEKTISKGMTAPGFTLNNLQGKSVSLKDYRGKYVLLDFWASWCPPCRAEHPLLVSLQKKYGSDIQFISLSMDASDKAWRQAVAADQLTWVQLNDPKSVNGETGDNYGVKALPFNCIINPEGKIMATKLRGKALEDFLASEFKK